MHSPVRFHDIGARRDDLAIAPIGVLLSDPLDEQPSISAAEAFAAATDRWGQTSTTTVELARARALPGSTVAGPVGSGLVYVITSTPVSWRPSFPAGTAPANHHDVTGARTVFLDAHDGVILLTRLTGG